MSHRNASPPPNARQAVIVLSGEYGDCLREVGGLTLIERQFRQLSALGVEEIVVVTAQAAQVPRPSSRVSASVRVVFSAGDEPWNLLQGVAAELDSRFLVVAGDLVVDQRLLEWLVARKDEVWITRTAGDAPELLGVLERRTVHSAGGRTFPAVATVPITSFSTYWARRRGEVPIHLIRVASEEEAAFAWSVLLDHVDKRTKDLPALLFDPPFENFLVRVLARTWVTPNQVTLLTTMLAFFCAWVFAGGRLLAGVLLAVLVEVLDGVDGKLARIKLMTSRIGELEHVLDFFYENAWYLAIGHALAKSGTMWSWDAALALVFFDLADNLAYAFLAWRGGGNLDEVSPFLRRFRLVAGRRNVYVWMLLPGVLLGAAHLAYGAIVMWAGVTATCHWGEALRVGRQRAAQNREERAHATREASANGERQKPPGRAQFRRSGSSGMQCRR